MTQLEKEIMELENLIKFWMVFKPEFKGLPKLKKELAQLRALDEEREMASINMEAVL